MFLFTVVPLAPYQMEPIMLRKFLKETIGATSIEYALIASLVGAAIVGGVTNLGSATEENYNQLGQDVQNATGG